MLNFSHFVPQGMDVVLMLTFIIPGDFDVKTMEFSDNEAPYWLHAPVYIMEKNFESRKNSQKAMRP